MNNRTAFVVTLALIACNGEDPSQTGNTPIEQDSGDGQELSEACEEMALVSSAPVDGAGGWYYRDALVFMFNNDASAEATFTADDGAGNRFQLVATFDEGGFNASVLPTGGTWTANTSYTINVNFCEQETSIGFSTNGYGAALEFNPALLVDNTYFVDIGGADFTEPPGVGLIIGALLSDPLLLGITDASLADISLVGAQGRFDGDTVVQRTNFTRYPVWDFGTADFSEQPYFKAFSDETVFNYSEQDIRVYDFELEGTFSADGETIGGARFRGLGDTRNLGPLIPGVGDADDATCTYLNGVLSIECEPCPDGAALCLTLAGELDDPYLLPELTLILEDASE